MAFRRNPSTAVKALRAKYRKLAAKKGVASWWGDDALRTSYDKEKAALSGGRKPRKAAPKRAVRKPRKAAPKRTAASSELRFQPVTAMSSLPEHLRKRKYDVAEFAVDPQTGAEYLAVAWEGSDHGADDFNWDSWDGSDPVPAAAEGWWKPRGGRGGRYNGWASLGPPSESDESTDDALMQIISRAANHSRTMRKKPQRLSKTFRKAKRVSKPKFYPGELLGRAVALGEIGGHTLRHPGGGPVKRGAGRPVHFNPWW